MTTGNSPALPPEEQARRRDLVAGADWSCRMERLGKPSTERAALDESWITGQISRDEYEARPGQGAHRPRPNSGFTGTDTRQPIVTPSRDSSGRTVDDLPGSEAIPFRA